MSDTPIAPSAASLTLAGVAATLVAATATIRTPTIGAVSFASSAGSVISQLQTPDIPGTVNLLNSDSVTGIIKHWPGGAGLFSAVGTWGGATVTLQFVGPDGATFIPVGTSTTLTANGAGSFNLPPGKIQAAITNATSTSITAAAQVLPTLIG